eukprot:TRINITY_DN114286_c0_g1_i1.p1 TRINITY_DN114286_c0_g1~~TRINITY_DN114286_c0_g1_i1.p1  ORF type:complete len:141 (-),score=30.97 TRINITY_DN114286_c0_g1_i1:45-440(-)
MATAVAELGPQPVLLNNNNGWANVTRFASLAMVRLAETRRRAQLSGAAVLVRALSRIQQGHKQEGLQKLRQHATLRSFALARGRADEELQRLRLLADSFELEVDDAVDAMCRQVLDEEEDEPDVMTPVCGK